MSLLIIVGAAVVIYLCRASGFLFHKRFASVAWDERLSYVPIGVFSALIVTSVMGQPALMIEKSLTLLVAGVFIARTRRVGLGTVLGFVLFWMLDGLG